MKIGIIGSGEIGGSLTRRLSKLGHEVFIANSRGPASLADLAAETGATAVTVHQAARSGEVVFVAIPEWRIPDLPNDLFDGVSPDVVVVDGNYYPRERDGRIDEIEEGVAESRWVANQLGRPVLKVINTLHWRSLLDEGKPAGAPGRIALPIAGDDEAHKEKVTRLFDELGFDGVDAGRLDESWRQQPGTPAYAANLDADGVRRALTAASSERKPSERKPELRAAPKGGKGHASVSRIAVAGEVRGPLRGRILLGPASPRALPWAGFAVLPRENPKKNRIGSLFGRKVSAPA